MFGNHNLLIFRYQKVTLTGLLRTTTRCVVQKQVTILEGV